MRIFKAGALRGAEMRRLRRELALTRWGLWAESAVRAFWPVFVILCLALALALLGVFAAFGPTGHRILLGVLALALIAGLVAGGARFRRPDEAAVRARLDRSDPRRPLATLDDELAVGRGAGPTESVWRAHRQRAAAAAARLRAGWPDLRLSSRDRWALRLFAPALLITGLIATGGDWTGRIATIADPAPIGAAPAAGKPVAMAEAWATPPAYTGLGTIYLQRIDGRTDPDEGAAAAAAPPPVQVPQGSELTIRVTDAGDLPTLEGGALAGIEGFQTLGGGLAEARGVLSTSGQLVVGGPDGELARWAIEMIPDAPPEIALDGTPKATLTRALELGFRAKDDYGVTAAWAEMAPEGHDPQAARGLPLPVISFGLPLPITGHAAEVEESAIRDFTAHPWAGAEVMLRLYAEDGAGQVTATEPLRITLPDRRFSHPLARALVEQRRELALDYAESARVLDVLQAVTRRPDEIFDDPGVFLTVRSAIRRLAYGIGTETVADEAPSVVELLWQAALALEDGDLSAALERLRTAQEAAAPGAGERLGRGHPPRHGRAARRHRRVPAAARPAADAEPERAAAAVGPEPDAQPAGPAGDARPVAAAGRERPARPGARHAVRAAADAREPAGGAGPEPDGPWPAGHAGAAGDDPAPARPVGPDLRRAPPAPARAAARPGPAGPAGPDARPAARLGRGTGPRRRARPPGPGPGRRVRRGPAPRTEPGRRRARRSSRRRCAASSTS